MAGLGGAAGIYRMSRRRVGRRGRVMLHGAKFLRPPTAAQRDKKGRRVTISLGIRGHNTKFGLLILRLCVQQ